MALLWPSSSISPPLRSLQPPIPSTITSKCSISNPHIPKTFRIGFPYLTHQPLCCSYSTSQSEPSTSPSTGVFIKGLPQSTAEGRLKKVFSQFGEVKQVHVVRERVSKQSLGSAFVWFDNEESVQLAVNELNGKVAFLAIMVTLISWFPPHLTFITTELFSFSMAGSFRLKLLYLDCRRNGEGQHRTSSKLSMDHFMPTK